MPTPPRTADPAFTGSFTFSVGDVLIGAFTEVSGLSVEVEVEELVEGGQNEFVHKLPGRMKWPNIVLKRGVIKDDALFEWLTDRSTRVSTGDGLERSTGHIAVLDPQGNDVRNWAFKEAFPVRWSGPTLAASSSDLAVEELEIAHHGFASVAM